jgi:hypothetical protein
MDFESDSDSDVDELESSMADKAADIDKEVRIALLIYYLSETKPKIKRKKRVVYDRVRPWEFIDTWSPSLFKRQFRMSKARFYLLRGKCISVYPGKYDTGQKNYRYAKKQGNNGGGCIPLNL